MKKLIILFVFTLLTALTVSAQDRIVRTDASEVNARVMEITPDEVRYKRVSNLDGPTYVQPISGVHYILYANGEKEVFNELAEVKTDSQQALPAQPAPPVLPVAPTQPDPSASVPAGYVLRTYEIGDYYEADGVRGVVCELSDDKRHGLLISLDEAYVPWSTFKKPNLRMAGVADVVDGESNMQAMERYISEKGLSWSDFPAFEWCREQGAGWYLPAIDELLHAFANYNGGSRVKNNRSARDKFNKALTDEGGGKRIDRLGFYFSSTERDEKSAICSHATLEPPYVSDILKSTRFYVRAVRKF